MRTLLGMAAVLGVLSVAGDTDAAAPVLAKGRRVRDAGIEITLNTFLAPEAVDWNNDGRQDILLGQYTYGYVNLFTNVSDGLPRFNGYSLLESSGSPITTSYG